MTLKEKWNAECTKLGLVIKHGIGSVLLAASMIGALADWANQLPPIIADSVPQWAKLAIFLCGAAAHIGGGLSVKKPNTSNSTNTPNA